MFKRHTLVVKYDCNEGNFEENANITVSYTGAQCVKICRMEINELAMTSAVKGYSRITRGQENCSAFIYSHARLNHLIEEEFQNFTGKMRK